MHFFSSDSIRGLLAWWDSIDTFLIDCDGVLWRATDGILGVDQTLQAIRDAGKSVYFVTNNSTKTRADYLYKLEHVAGIRAVETEIMSSAFAAALYCQEAGMTKKVYVIGQDGLIDELRRVGVEPVGLDDGPKKFHFGTFKPTDLDPDVEAVVAGFDGAVSYYKLAVACSLLRYHPHVKFVATNKDMSFPDTHQLVPGGGMIIAAIEAGSGRKPDVVAGKPSLGLLDIIARANPSFDRSRACMVGDRLDTDILFGNSGGLSSTLFVQTGISTQAEVDALSVGDPHRPTHIIESLGDLARLLELARGAEGHSDAGSKRGGEF